MSTRCFVIMTVLLAGCTGNEPSELSEPSGPATVAVTGPQAGDAAGPFNVKDCTGPEEGKTLCYR